MIVHCPKCGARANLGPNADDLSDNRYRGQCPLIFPELHAGGDEFECPHMQRVRFDEFVKFRLSAA